MANTVFQLRRSSVAGKVPTTSSLSIGELGLNMTDRILYSSDGSNIFQIGANVTSQNISTNNLTVGTTLYVVANGNIGVGNSSPSTKLSVNGTTYLYGNVTINSGLLANGGLGTSGQTLASNGSSVFWKNIVKSGAVAPTSPSADDLWWDTDNATLFIYYYDGSSSQWVETNPQVWVETTSGNYTLSGNATITGDATIQGTLYETSDVTLKDNIVQIDNPLDKIKALRGVDFVWKNNGKKSIGVIAQEIENILPQIVNTDDEGLKSVSYTAMIGLLIEAIKELSDRIEK